MAQVQVNPEILARIDRQITLAHETKRHRPMVAAVLRSLSVNRVLMIQYQSSGNLTFPQGGAEDGETAIKALIREIGEKTGIEGAHVTVRRFCHSHFASTTKRQRNGFGVAQQYFYFDVVCRSILPVTLCRRHPQRCEWVTPEDALALLAMQQELESMKERAIGMRAALSSALRM